MASLRHGKPQPDGSVDPAEGLFSWPELYGPTYLLTRQLEELCQADQDLQASVAKCLQDGCPADAMDLVRQDVMRVFEEDYLATVYSLFEAASLTVAQYLVAKRAYQQLHPEQN